MYSGDTRLVLKSNVDRSVVLINNAALQCLNYLQWYKKEKKALKYTQHMSKNSKKKVIV